MTRLFLVAMLSCWISACGDTGSSADGSPVPSQSEAPLYPVGPYGTQVGDVIVDATLTTDTEDTISLQVLHQDPERTVMLVFGTAGWCARCSIHMPSLKAIYTDLDPQGLFLALSIYENRIYGPAEPRDALNFRRLHELPFPVFADTDAHLTQYYEEVGMPMVMVVDLRTMVLLYAELSWEPDTVRTLIEAHL